MEFISPDLPHGDAFHPVGFHISGDPRVVEAMGGAFGGEAVRFGPDEDARTVAREKIERRMRSVDRPDEGGIEPFLLWWAIWQGARRAQGKEGDAALLAEVIKRLWLSHGRR